MTVAILRVGLLCCLPVLAACGRLDRPPPCDITIRLASAEDQAAVKSAAAVLTRRIHAMGGDVAAQSRDGARVRFTVNDCPVEQERLRKLLLSPGTFRLRRKDTGQVWLTEADLLDTQVTRDYNDARPAVMFRLTRGAAERFSNLTAGAVGTTLRIESDGKVVSEPVLRDPISGGTGQFGPMEAEQAMITTLALRSGPLPIGIREVKIASIANANE